jgi:hypothetical protein
VVYGARESAAAGWGEPAREGRPAPLLIRSPHCLVACWRDPRVYQSPAGAAYVPAVPMKNEEQLL